MLTGRVEDVVSGILGPSPPLWSALLPADRERVARWVQKPQAPAPRPHAEARHVWEMIIEQRRGKRLRAWRDAGLLVGIALMGAGVAIYVDPPVRAWLVWLSLVWLVALLILARFVVHRATGRGITGTPEGNVRYFGDPEAFAVGWPYSFSMGAGLATLIVLAALVARQG